MRTPKLPLVMVLAIAVVMSACVSSSFIANNMTGSLSDMRASFFSEPSPQHAMAAGPALLKMLDGFIVASPENLDLLASGAEMNCAYALTFLDSRDPDWSMALYSRGKDYGIRGLAVDYPDLADAVAKADEQSVRKAVSKVDKDGLPFLFWTGLCWGGYINASKEAHFAVDLPVVEVLMERALELDESYYFGSGHSFFGMLNSGIAAGMGTEVEKARTHFDRANELTQGRFLMTRLMMARSFAVNTKDPVLFRKLLEEIIAYDGPVPQNMVLANAVSRQEAQALLNRMGDFFPGYEETGEQPVEVPVEEPPDDLDLD